MERADLGLWLQERTALSILDEAVIDAIAPQLQPQTQAADSILGQPDSPPPGLYILESGQIEPVTPGPRAVSLLPGSTLYLEDLLLEQSIQQPWKCLSECQLWFLPRDAFRDLLQQFPNLIRSFSQELVQTVRQLSSRLDFEQIRQEVLRPYLVTKARRGIIGRSRYGTRLRNQVRDAFEQHQSVMIFGEPGLEKDNLAALMHYGSDLRREPIIKIDCSRIQESGAELFGRSGGKPGLIEALGQGTLIFNNVQELPDSLFPALGQLLEHHTYRPVGQGDDAQPQTSPARLVLVTEQSLPQLDDRVDTRIRVPPLRVRKADMGDMVKYFATLTCRARGIPRPSLTPEALRKLQAYDFPNNVRELESLVSRAISQMPPGADTITEEIIWPSQSKKKQFRFNLLNAYPKFRRFLRSPWWPDRINYGFTLAAFAGVVAVLWLGPQDRQHNFALNFFWAWWWPLILLAFPFVGRLWCAVCPFMIYGEVTQKLSLWLVPRQLKGWPRRAADRWGGWFLFGLFALILLWEELWDLQDTAYLSACLLLLITAGAMIFSAIFERRFWCRYLCPIGGMNGLFAKLSMTELRAQQGTCSAECTTYQCYKGGPQKGEGLETLGCPLYSHPAQLEDNRDCVLCMTCLKACPHRSVEVNLRPPGIELWTTHIARSYEVALLFLLLGAVTLHYSGNLATELNLPTANLGWLGLWSILALGLPGIAPLLAHRFTRLLGNPKPFVELAYGYLPLVLLANLAYYLTLGLTEAGRILPVGLATFGLSGSTLPIWVAHPAVVSFLQGTSLTAGVVLSILLSQKIARQPVRRLIPQHLCIVALGWGLGQLVLNWS